MTENNLQYFHCDFDFSTYSTHCLNTFTLPEILNEEEQSKKTIEREYCQHWNTFFSCHTSGSVYKPRRYLLAEFSIYIPRDEFSIKSIILEVGCGHGCSIFPLIETTTCSYIASDYSVEALAILEQDKKFDPSRITTLLWDLTEPPPESIEKLKANAILCVFTLSAIHPDHHLECMKHMAMTLSCESFNNNKSSILFRDYAIHDMTMYRHSIRFSDKLFMRNDKTLAYYFDYSYLTELCSMAGLSIVEMEYATVTVRNRKTKSNMNRVFLHAVLQLKH